MSKCGYQNLQNVSSYRMLYKLTAECLLCVCLYRLSICYYSQLSAIAYWFSSSQWSPQLSLTRVNLQLSVFQLFLYWWLSIPDHTTCHWVLCYTAVLLLYRYLHWDTLYLFLCELDKLKDWNWIYQSYSAFNFLQCFFGTSVATVLVLCAHTSGVGWILGCIG